MLESETTTLDGKNNRRTGSAYGIQAQTQKYLFLVVKGRLLPPASGGGRLTLPHSAQVKRAASSSVNAATRSSDTFE